MLTEPCRQWRLLDSGPADGFINMAVDEAILELHTVQGSSPTLRFYTWSPPAVSLGYGQAVGSDIDLARCRAFGIDVVRRPTGGRAVLHEHEVTYSLVIRADDHRVAQGVLAPYLLVSQALIRGLSHLGISAELLPPRRANMAPTQQTVPVCFSTLSSYEIAVHGRKIVGSAQRRTHGVIMQHGSVPLSWDWHTMRAVFGRELSGGQSKSQEHYARMTSLQEAGGRVYKYPEVVAALVRGIAETWEVEFFRGQLTTAETQLSAQLRDEKYRTDSWTWRR